MWRGGPAAPGQLIAQPRQLIDPVNAARCVLGRQASVQVRADAYAAGAETLGEVFDVVQCLGQFRLLVAALPAMADEGRQQVEAHNPAALRNLPRELIAEVSFVPRHGARV